MAWRRHAVRGNDYVDGKLIDCLEAKHTHVEWLRFLKQIDRETPVGVDIHVIADNCATHKHAKVKAWLARHPRFEMHFTTTSSSWLNLVARIFADLTAVVREGSFESVNQLRGQIVATWPNITTLRPKKMGTISLTPHDRAVRDKQPFGD